MRRLTYIVLLGFLGVSMALQADDDGYDDDQGDQPKNRKPHKNYEYYEDYLKDQRESESESSKRKPEDAIRKAFAPYLRGSS